MLIEVIFYDHNRARVEAVSISSLIREDKILAFKRSSGWVHIGKDRIRRCDFEGRERTVIESGYKSDLPGMQGAYS